MNRRATLELRIDGLAAGGDGVGRAPDGRVVFVPFAAPGDRLRVALTEERARFARGRVEALLEPGPQRVDPACPVFGSCGGCAWQHVVYPAQLEAKAGILTDALSRIGGIALDEPIAITPSPSPWRYRGRTRVLVRGGRVGYRRRRSHALCATERCPVLVEALERRLHDLAARPLADGEWELTAAGGEVRAVRLPARRGPRLAMRVGGRALGVSPGVFAQSNALLLDALAAAVVEAAGRGRLALDLFAGAGTFSLGLAERFEGLVAVEADLAAARDLRANLRAAGAERIEVLGERLEAALARGAFDGARPDAVVLDPPRTGLSAGTPAALAALGAARIVYLSCDPATLARDLGVLVERGYGVRAVSGFDLFPQTPHVEALAVLEHGAGKPIPG